MRLSFDFGTMENIQTSSPNSEETTKLIEEVEISKVTIIFSVFNKNYIQFFL